MVSAALTCILPATLVAPRLLLPRRARLHSTPSPRRAPGVGATLEMNFSRPPTMKFNADQRCALVLLARNPRGCTDAILEMAHGFNGEMLAELVRDGLAYVTPEPMRAGGRAITVGRFHITEAGRRALAGRA
jgi:hypothetical protein